MTRSKAGAQPQVEADTKVTTTAAEHETAFDAALHGLRLEGRTLDLKSVPEFDKVIRNEMTSEEAIESIIARRRKN
ncbi:MAG: antitoxin VbhA family protein [Beijerinckiaceae bacterium]|jgi:hypothetical protein